MRTGILLLLIGLFLTTAVQAQEVKTSGPITLQEAIEIALENNNQLQIAENDIALTERRIRSERADYLPSFDASMGGNRNVGRGFNENTGQITTRANNSFRSTLSASIPIFSGFENLHSLRGSRYDKRSNEENLQRVREEIIFETVSNYLQYILDQKILEIDRENLATQQKTLEQVRAQVEVGSRPTVDLYDQESTVASNELAVVNSENNLQSSRLDLIQTLQVDPLKDYEFASPEIDEQTVAAPDYDLDELVTTALENRSDLKSEEFNIQSLKQQLEATRGSLYPSLSLSANFGSSYSELQPLSFQDQFFDSNINRSFGLSVNIPIFGNLNRQTNVQTQQINYKNAQLRLRDTELQIVQEVNQEYNNYESYIKELEANEKALTAAERAYETQKQRYEVGSGTLIELSEANAQYVEAQSNRAQALFRTIFQQKVLDYYIGRITEDITL